MLLIFIFESCSWYMWLISQRQIEHRGDTDEHYKSLSGKISDKTETDIVEQNCKIKRCTKTDLGKNIAIQ